MSTSTHFPDSNKPGVPSTWQFDKNLGQHLGEYTISIIKMINLSVKPNFA